MEERKDNLEEGENVRFLGEKIKKKKAELSVCIDKTSEHQLMGIYEL